MIDVCQVSKSYGPFPVLHDVTFRAQRGEVLLLLGDNGAGKTTLVRSILGLTDYEGSIRVGDLDPLSQGKAARSLIGYMPQSGGLHLDLSVTETVEFYGALRRVPQAAARERLADVDLEEVGQSRVGELSIGMRQRLGFAVATLSDPPVLLLDEPTASLDAKSCAVLARRLREMGDRGKTVLLSTHSQSQLADVSDRALWLEEGRLSA
jgi:ABC-type multidrug transport system ATPase subunit